MSELQQLFDKYINNQCSPEEVETLMNFFHADDQGELSHLILLELEKQDADTDSDHQSHEALLNKVYGNIKSKIDKSQGNVISIWPRVMAAASILIFLSVGGYFLLLKTARRPQIAQKNEASHSKAFLTLANGEKVGLDDAKIGDVTKQSGVVITKASNGLLVYTVSRSASPQASPNYNTIETSKGGQYQVNLPDGTKVWLNAASSLKYPLQFSGSQRRVELTGEGYFEVTKDKTKPFIVITAAQQIEVLGTHFNVSAYSDESSVHTTLLEGSVKLTASSGGSAILKPGQESVLSNNDFTVQKADTESVMAWKNGYFYFDEDLESIMKKLARWYDVQVVYDIDKGRQMRYGGKISRSKNIYAVLKIMEATGNIHFKIEGRRVTVMN